MIKRAEMQNKSFKMHHLKIKFPQNVKLKTNLKAKIRQLSGIEVSKAEMR